MGDHTIRIFRNTPGLDNPPGTLSLTDWHVSVGDRAPLQELRSLAVAEGLLEPGEEGRSDFLGGLGWDEALESVALAMIAPGAMGPRLRYHELPLSGSWRLVVSIEPLGGAEFAVTGPEERWDRLTLGEALAQFVALTYRTGWKGFWSRSGRMESWALMRTEGACERLASAGGLG